MKRIFQPVFLYDKQEIPSSFVYSTIEEARKNLQCVIEDSKALNQNPDIVLEKKLSAQSDPEIKSGYIKTLYCI